MTFWGGHARPRGEICLVGLVQRMEKEKSEGLLHRGSNHGELCLRDEGAWMDAEASLLSAEVEHDTAAAERLSCRQSLVAGDSLMH